MQTRRDLGEILIEEGLIDQANLELALAEEARSGKSAWNVLLEHGQVTERDLLRARAAQIGLDFSDLAKEQPDADALGLVPEDIIRRQVALPMSLLDGALVVAMAEPRNHLAVEELAQVSGKQIVPAVAYREDLAAAIDRAFSQPNSPPPPPQGQAAPPPTSFGPGDLVEAPSPPLIEADVGPAEEVDKEPNLAEFLIAVLEGAGSDLHLTAGLPPMIRVHGEIQPIKGYRKLMPRDLQQLIYSMLTQKQRENFEEHLELDVSYALPGKARFRVNVFQQRDAVGSVMRLIPYEIKSVDDLGLPPAVLEFARLRRGLVLVTGITGSGKSTSLAALIDYINSTRHEHIMTVEDPIEFLHTHKKSVVNQREVGTDTYSFAEALKRVLRQDPDVILVGEMRDLETISTALTAAETGHLVFGTLHTQDAPQSVDRVIDVFPPHAQQQIRVQLASSIAGVMSQQLVPLASGKGRAVAAEILVATPAVRNLIREGKTHQIYTSMQAGGKYGMQVMDQHLAEIVKSGKVRYEVALERCHKVEEFNRLVGKG
ncbi:MAG: PilT/PilU family type 4a pilus ATPase [Actinomycetota bacterium]